MGVIVKKQKPLKQKIRAIVPQVAFQIFKAIMEVEKGGILWLQ
jgi:hypothetical protein